MSRYLRDMIYSVTSGDQVLLVTVMTLCLIGLISVYDAGSFRIEASSSTFYLAKFGVRMMLGWAALIIAAQIDYHRLRNWRWRYSFVALGSGLVLATVLLQWTGLVAERAGAARWIFLVQPVEIAKLAVILELAFWLGPGWDRVSREPRKLWRALTVPIVTVVALTLQPNYGNAVVLSVLTLHALTLSGLPASWFWRLGVGAAVLVTLGVLTVSRIHTRVTHWWASLLNGDWVYQVDQGVIAMGSGGLTGQGVGASRQRLAFLPDAHTDFIYAVIGEETGLIGAVVVLFLFGLLAVRGYKIAREAGDGFGRLLASGITSMLLIYAMINVGMVTGILPVMGLPLPFISYGGSALVTNLAAIGVLINIDRQKREMNSRLQRMRLS